MQQYFHQHPIVLAVIIVLVIWSAVWKAARAEDKVWFVVLFILNTAGLLEIFYIFSFSKRPRNQELPKL